LLIKKKKKKNNNPVLESDMPVSGMKVKQEKNVRKCFRRYPY